MSLIVVFVDVVAVVSNYQGDFHVFGEFYDPGHDFLLTVKLMVLDFHIQIVRTEYIPEFTGRLTRLSGLPGAEERRDLSLYTCSERDESLVIFLQQLFVDASTVVKSLQIRAGHKLHQVLISGFIFCQ